MCSAASFAHAVPEIPLVHDVVAVENAAGLVPRELHSNTLWNSSADEVTHCCSTEVVQDAFEKLRPYDTR